MDAFPNATGPTLTQLDNEHHQRVVAYGSEKISPAEQQYSANDMELLGLMNGLLRFSCYLEGISFTMFKDIQIRGHLFKKKANQQKGGTLVGTLPTFNIKELCLNSGGMNVFGDAPSRIPHCKINNITITEII